jgi:putative nucleotidyltransferase with HDIG domain
MRELTLQNLINRVDELPEVPQIAFRAIQLLNNPETDVSSLAQVISSDQALTAKVLRLCNSAFYGLSRQVTTISEAVVIVGFSSLKSLVLMLTTQSSMNKGLLGYKIGPGEFWRHSLNTAEITRFLAQHTGANNPEEAFIAGLIHDIGKMALNQYALPEVYRATNLSQKERLPIHEAETQVLGFDHADVGAALTERWNFPPVLVEAIRRHHSFAAYAPTGTPEALPLLVSTANLLAQSLEHDHPLNWNELQGRAPLLDPLGLSVEQLRNLLPGLRQRVTEANEMLQLLD